MRRRTMHTALAVFLSSLLLTACPNPPPNEGGPSAIYTVGGNVSGLVGSIVLKNNAGDDLGVSADGAFTFATSLANGSAYSVTVSTQPIGQSCSVANGAGVISSANVANVAITCAANTYVISGTVAGLNGGMVLQNNGGDDLAVTANGAFTFATAVSYGGGYNVTLRSLQFPNQTCGITGGSGRVTAKVTGVTVTCAKNTAPRFAYVANSGNNSVSIYRVDAVTGQLRHNGYAMAGTNPQSVTVDPSGRFAYVANSASNNISAYTIDASTGMLAPIYCDVGPMCTWTNFIAGTGPQSVTVDPTGKFAYVANRESHDISVYSIDASTGALTSVGVPVAAGASPVSVTIDPSGRFAYAANSNSSDISGYTINASTGALTSIGARVAAGAVPFSVTVDPSGKFAYAANFASNNVSAYSINASTGALTSIGTVAAGSEPYAVAIDPSGKFAYVANYLSNNVSSFSINPTTGALTSIGPEVATGTYPVSVTVDPSGKFAYVTNWGSDDVSSYAINVSTGALTPLSIVTARSRGAGMAMVSGARAAIYTPQFAYVANYYGASLSQYLVGADGALTSMPVATVAAGTNPSSVTVDPSGKYAYAVNSGGASISQYTVGADGALTPMMDATVATGVTGVSPLSITLEPSGRFAYVANIGSANVSQFIIGLGGALTPMVTATIGAGTSPKSVAVDPSGRYAYVPNGGSANISQYTIHPVTGVLTPMATATVSTGGSPASVAIDPSGKYAYVTNWSSNNISQYMIGTGGALTPMATAAVAAGAVPVSVAVDPSGKYAYVANFNSVFPNFNTGSISQYTIGANGALTPMSTAAVATGTSPYSVTVDPSGKYVYATNSFNGTGGNTVSQYAVGADGSLAPMATPAVAAGTVPYSMVITGSYQ